MEQYVLHVTHKCNLRCKYCYERERDITYTQEEIKKTCDEIAKCKERCNVEFIGGEPLLAFDHIQFAHEYLSEHGNVEEFTISTNLTILTEVMLQWIIEHDDVRISVSLDGTRYANQLRVYPEGEVNAYDQTVANVKKLVHAIPKDRLSVHMVAHKYNVALIASSIRHIYELGVRHVAVGIIESTWRIDKDFALRYLEEMNQISRERMEGKLPDLQVSEQDGLKPKSDKRTYVYDDEGKMIFESYGRAEDDAITKGDVKSEVPSSPVGDFIHNIRTLTYQNHQAREYARVNVEDPKSEYDKVLSLEKTRENLQPMVDKFDLKLYQKMKAPHTFITYIESPYSGIAEGKGTTKLASEVSCLAEFAERCALPVGMNSNGCAAGNTRGEAILQASCEVFERYFMYHSAVNEKVLYPTVDPLSIEDPRICELYFWFMKQGYKLYIKQLSDLVPTYGIYYENCKKPLEDYTRYSYVVGSSFNSDIALLRAFTEKQQVLMNTEGVYLNYEKPMLDLLFNCRSLWDTRHLMKGQVIKYLPRRTAHLSDDLAELQAILCMWDRDIEITDHENEWMPVVSVRIEEMMNLFGEEDIDDNC